jgi:hypothetical protein
MGIGRALLSLHRVRALTLRGAVDVLRSKSTYLPRILHAHPIPVGHGAIEVHMLLHHQRLFEGIWALYSFVHFTGVPCQVIIHSDGSLTGHDVARLRTVLPGAEVISRRAADQVVLARMRELGLVRSIQFRDRLVFALKLFDPFFFGKHANMIVLDSDVLFFKRPDELVDGIHQLTQDALINLYSPDNGFRYCLGRETLHALLGEECIAEFNPGIMRTHRNVLDLERVEAYLQRPEFWGSGSRPHYYAELTLWAMLLTSAGARRLPANYAITPPLDGPVPASGHYCGGGYPATWFYSRGLPRLAHAFGI